MHHKAPGDLFEVYINHDSDKRGKGPSLRALSLTLTVLHGLPIFLHPLDAPCKLRLNTFAPPFARTSDQQYQGQVHQFPDERVRQRIFASLFRGPIMSSTFTSFISFHPCRSRQSLLFPTRQPSCLQHIPVLHLLMAPILNILNLTSVPVLTARSSHRSVIVCVSTGLYSTPSTMVLYTTSPTTETGLSTTTTVTAKRYLSTSRSRSIVRNPLPPIPPSSARSHLF